MAGSFAKHPGSSHSEKGFPQIMHPAYDRSGWLRDLPRWWAFLPRRQRLNFGLYVVAALFLVATVGELALGGGKVGGADVLAIGRAPAASQSTVVATIPPQVDPPRLPLALPPIPPPVAAKVVDAKSDPAKPGPGAKTTTTTKAHQDPPGSPPSTYDTVPPFLPPVFDKPTTTTVAPEATTTTKAKGNKSTTTTSTEEGPSTTSPFPS